VQAAMESMSVLAAMAVMIVLIALSFLGSGFWTRLRATASAPRLERTSGIHSDAQSSSCASCAAGNHVGFSLTQSFGSTRHTRIGYSLTREAGFGYSGNPWFPVVQSLIYGRSNLPFPGFLSRDGQEFMQLRSHE
jgi:hypothetical protein